MPTSTAAVYQIPTVRPYLSARYPLFLEECVAIAIVGLCPADQIGRRASDPIFQCWDNTHSCKEDIQWQQNPCRRLSKFKPGIVFGSNMVFLDLKNVRNNIIYTLNTMLSSVTHEIPNTWGSGTRLDQWRKSCKPKDYYTKINIYFIRQIIYPELF